MLAAVDDVALGGAAAGLVLVLWLFRELAWAHRWHALVEAMHALANALDDLAVVIVDELEADEADGPDDG